MGAIRAVAFGVIAVLVSPYFLPEPPIVSEVEDLSSELQDWYKRGKFSIVNGHKVFYIHELCTNPGISHPPTFVIVHGFPSSSYEYYKVIEPLRAYGNVFVHDHVGFGFSDKPVSNFTYSLSEAAENSLVLWKKQEVKKAHVIAHDMGDTILTEILARRHRKLLPEYYRDFFQSVTFTNGGMKYSMINFRIGQVLLSNEYFGPYFNKLSVHLGIGGVFLRRQLLSLWGSDPNVLQRDRDLTCIEDLVEFKGGSLILHKTIYYLWDRAHFEFRWFAALANIDIRTRFIWGDSDAASPIGIPQYISSFVPGSELYYVSGAGHFWMLERPDEWIKYVVKLVT